MHVNHVNCDIDTYLLQKFNNGQFHIGVVILHSDSSSHSKHFCRLTLHLQMELRDMMQLNRRQRPSLSTTQYISMVDLDLIGTMMSPHRGNLVPFGIQMARCMFPNPVRVLTNSLAPQACCCPLIIPCQCYQCDSLVPSYLTSKSPTLYFG